MRRRAVLACLLAWATMSASCAADRRREPATAGAEGEADAHDERSPAMQPPPGRTPSQDDAAESPAFAPPPPEAAPAAGGAAAPDGRALALTRAQRDLDVARRELEVAAGDCQSACRALGSMDRAAGRLCELADAEAARPRCEEAKRALYAARDRVRTTCGDCPGGPSVERNAPVPSSR
jgi:hypothetical protein